MQKERLIEMNSFQHRNDNKNKLKKIKNEIKETTLP